MNKNLFGHRTVKPRLVSIPEMAMLLLIILVSANCSKTSSQMEPGWEQKIIEMRRMKDQSFREFPSSPLAGIKRLTVLAGEKSFLVTEGSDIIVSDRQEENTRLALIGKDGTWTWENSSSDTTCLSRDQEVPSGAVLPGRVTFKIDRLLLVAYPSAKRLILIVFDPERPQFKNFKGLSYYPPNPKYAVSAAIEKLSNMSPLKMLTCRNLEKTFYRYAKIKFKLDGQSLELTAFKSNPDPEDQSDVLFIPFNDNTNGSTTYGTGRFFEIAEPAENQFIFDFNSCFNPLCSYSPAYNCPIPPSENFLNIAIPAGEKIYSHH